MFLPPKLTTILLGQLIALTMLASSANGQQSDFERRLAAMQQARARAQAPATSPVRVASSDVGVDYTAPPTPPKARVASRPQVVSKLSKETNRPAPRVAKQSARPQAQARVAQGSGSTGFVPQGSGSTTGFIPQGSGTSTGIIPQHLQTAPPAQSFVDGGSPIISSQPVDTVGGTTFGESYISDEVVTEGCPCGSCGGGDTYFGQDPCCGRSTCYPGAQNLVGGAGRALGAAVYTAEFFGGATAFRSPLFETPGGNAGELSDDSSQGFFGGFNLGIPLWGLSGGLLSGQVGIRSVQTNFNGNEFSSENRDQLFITAGFFRRVDYGIQAGVVADILHEEWFTENDLVQIRGEVGWVFGGGRSWGFRFATNTQDDITSGTFAGNSFTNLVTSTEDNYRFFIRSERASSGYGEIFIGWSDLEQTVVGLDFDVAVTERVGVQAGFTYYLTDDGLPTGTTNLAGGNSDEAFNVFVGFVLRPRGRSYYNSYDRPLFSVADNGSFLITRENQ